MFLAQRCSITCCWHPFLPFLPTRVQRTKTDDYKIFFLRHCTAALALHRCCCHNMRTTAAVNHTAHLHLGASNKREVYRKKPRKYCPAQGLPASEKRTSATAANFAIIGCISTVNSQSCNTGACTASHLSDTSASSTRAQPNEARAVQVRPPMCSVSDQVKSKYEEF